MAIPEWTALLGRYRKTIPYKDVLAFDPGETTGYAYFKGHNLVQQGQVKTGTVEGGVKELHAILERLAPDFVVVEEYRVYGWKTDEHANAALHTPQLIGAIKTLCAVRGIKVKMQTAQAAKTWMTDDKLKQWDMWAKGQRHARDAVRHALLFILFNEEKIK